VLTEPSSTGAECPTGRRLPSARRDRRSRGGDYGGANLISAYGAYSLTDNMKVDLTLSQFLGNASNGFKAELGITHVIVPEWRLSPFLELGTGVVHVVFPSRRGMVPAVRALLDALVEGFKDSGPATIW